MMWLPYVREPRYELVKLRRLPAYAVPTPGYLRRALDAGASGYLLRTHRPTSSRTRSAAFTRAAGPLILSLRRKPGATRIR